MVEEKPERISPLVFSATAVTAAGQMSQGRPEIFLIFRVQCGLSMLGRKTFLCLFTVNDDPNFEAMPGDSLAPVVLREARDSNLRRPDPPPSLLGWMVGGGDHDG